MSVGATRRVALTDTESGMKLRHCIFFSVAVHSAALLIPIERRVNQKPTEVVLLITEAVALGDSSATGLPAMSEVIKQKEGRSTKRSIPEKFPESTVLPEQVLEDSKKKTTEALAQTDIVPEEKTLKGLRQMVSAPTGLLAAGQSSQVGATVAVASVESSEVYGPDGYGGSAGASAGSENGTLAGSSPRVMFGSPEGPQFLRRAVPQYPEWAKGMGKEGLVLLRLTINEHGRLINVQIVERAGFGFDEEAVAAVKQSKFVPAQRRGRPTACTALLPVRFVLER